jgi:F-type H+-transporting ATPase subunit a
MEGAFPRVTFLGLVFDLSTVLMVVIASFLVFLIVFFSARTVSNRIPSGMQNFMEWIIDFVRGLARQSMDNKTSERFITLGVTLFLYLFVANQIGLVANFETVHTHPNASIGITQSIIDAAIGKGKEGAVVGWWKSPTASVSIPFALAIMVLMYTHWLGLRQGVGSYFKSYVTPHWAILPLNLVEELSKFLSFPLRLYGNIFAGEVLIAVLLPAIMGGIGAKVFALPLLAWIGYSVFVGSIQAFIFTILTMVYISHRVQSHAH